MNYDFAAAADLHIHSKVPKNRKGNYFNQVITKFSALLEIVQENTRTNLLVVAGDFFDAADVPYKVVRLVMEILKETKVNILVVPGQHDLRYHVSGLDNTPLGVLATSNQVFILTPKMANTTIGGVTFVGAGWNEEPKDECDILVMHRMITEKEELWPGQTDYSTAHAVLRKYPWASCIISGDNHLPHVIRVKEKGEYRLQINCGSMVRSTKTQINFEPRIHLINKQKWKSKSIKIPILPTEDVFDFNKIAIEEIKQESKEKAEEKIKEFINLLPKKDKEKPNFKNILSEVVQKAKPRNNVQQIINSTMERVS